MLMKKNGFTLIELMITVAIVAIIASIALPSYQTTVAKSRRADAKVALMGFANAMERHLTINNTFCNAADGSGSDTCGDGGNNDRGAPSIFSNRSPSDGNTIYYNLTISLVSASSYTLLATPVNGQTGDGILTLTHTGVRAWDKDGSNSIDAGEQTWDEH